MAAIGVAALVLTGCSSAPAGDIEPVSGAVGEPQPGGNLRAIQAAEPRSLDPAVLTNTWTTQGFLGNALFDTLLINDPETGEVEGRLATDFSTDDGGSTFILELQAELTFTDDTPLDAAAVKFNWDRLRDPNAASSARNQAAWIESTEVVDDQTLRVTMSTPSPHYAEAVVNSSMNWIASPAALEAGPEAFNENPVGAGPFMLESWSRQDVIELVKNPAYWDAPRPYVDSISLRSTSDTNQRMNTLTTGGADVMMESNWATIDQATNSGYPVEVVPTSGGQFIAMNSRIAPFDDVRARRAVSLATNLESLDLATYNGTGRIPETLFVEESPFYSDKALSRHDPEEAQALFDELAEEGKPVSFTYTAFATAENRANAEALQAQLSAFDNVDVQVNVVDFPTGLAALAAKDFQMMISSSTIQDPDHALWQSFHSSSGGNNAGLADDELDRALEAGRSAESVDERKEAYDVVQDRLIELSPGIFFTRAAPSVVTSTDVGGVHMYGLGSLLPAELWLQK